MELAECGVFLHDCANKEYINRDQKMNIAEICYQHVKVMPTAKALEVLQFIAFIETKNNSLENAESDNDLLEFIQHLPATKNAVMWKSINRFKH